MPLVVAALVLSGCTAQPSVIEDSAVTVATQQAFFSYNDQTSYGRSAANGAIVEATSSVFSSYDANARLAEDPSFGSYTVLSEDPLTVKYTIADRVTWSDGTAVDAADLLLAWVAGSGVRNTPDFDDSDYVDPETGKYRVDFPRDVVFFDGARSEGLQLATRLPTIGDHGRSLTVVWDRYVADWPLLLDVGRPAHVVAGHALKIDDRAKAKRALIAAIEDDDTNSLAAISRFWNSAYNFTSMPADDSLLVSTGPYTITDLVADDHITLTANPRYSGAHRPAIEKVTVRFISDPLSQVEALRRGDVDVIAPQPSAEVAAALPDLAGSVTHGQEGGYEHLDLQIANSKSGLFADHRIRQAFLKVIPRQQILSELIAPTSKKATLRQSQVFLPGSDGYVDSSAKNGSRAYLAPDVAGAKALLAEASVVAPTVCILFDPANPRRLREFELIQHGAAAAGFAVTDCSSPDWLNLLGTPGAYDASLFAWTASNSSVASVAAIFATSGKNNTNFYSNAKVDELIEALAAPGKPGEAVRLRQRIDSLVWADSYGLPLYQFPAVVASSERVTGPAPAPFASDVLWNLWQWKPAKSR